MSEAYGCIVEAVPGAADEEVRLTAQVATAQLNAVFSGIKPAFLETIQGFTESLAASLPLGCYYARLESGLDCIYNAAAVAQECNLPLGADVHAYVVNALEQGTYGRVLGYGMETAYKRPGFYVKIKRNGKTFFGFMTSPVRVIAEKYADARLNDLLEEFPGDQWDAILIYRP